MWNRVFKLALLVAVLVWFRSIYVDQIHWQEYRRERERLETCKSYAREVGITLSWYLHDHNYEPPQSIEALKAYHETSSKNALKPPAGEHYVYNFRKYATDMDIVLWDADVHHVHGGHGCMIRNGDFRTVAYANGTVREMPERDFERLHPD